MIPAIKVLIILMVRQTENMQWIHKDIPSENDVDLFYETCELCFIKF